MPAVSISQQRLMAQAYEVRKFLDSKGKEGMNPKSINSEYREEIVNLAKSMKKKDLEDFAKTKHKNLPNRIIKDSVDENSTVATVSSVNGMGNSTFPGNPSTQNDFINQKSGSGDIPFDLTQKRKKKKSFLNYREYFDQLKSTK